MATLGEVSELIRRDAETARKQRSWARIATVLDDVLKKLEQVDSVPSSPPEEDVWLTPDVVAARLQITKRAVFSHARKWERDGWAHRLGPRTWRFSTQGLERHLRRERPRPGVLQKNREAH